jgi:hypothetical protein
MPRRVNAVTLAAVELQEVLKSIKVPFCIIGGLAVQRWGEPRLTVDADATILTRFVEDEKWTDLLLSRFAPRRPDAREFALRNRVLLLVARNGVSLDVSLGALDFEARSIERATYWRYAEDIRIKTCSAADLVVHKAFAGRDRDWADIEGVLLRQGPRLDLAQVRAELVPLLELKEDAAALPRLARLCNECGLEFPGRR